jgi:putative ABC transport system permease protein
MLHDLRWAVRWLGKNPRFALAIIAILALGIGVNTAVFSMVDAILLRPLPYPSSNRLVRIEESSTRRASLGIPASHFFRWRERRGLFERLLAYRRDEVTLTGAGDPEQIWAMRTSPELFSLLGVRAEAGRTLLASDEQPSSGNPAVLSHRLWERQFHGDPKALGRTFTLSGELFAVVGVAPADFEFPNPEVELWAPLRLSRTDTYPVEVFGRAKQGLPLSQLQSAMTIVARQIEHEQPKEQAGLRIEVSPWRELLPRELELTLLFLLAAVGLVLLIGCANVAGLLLSRAVKRQKELAIRASLGAGFWRVLRQLLAESLVLAFAASLAGVASARFALQGLGKVMAALPVSIPNLQRIALHGRVLLFSTGLCLLTALICGLAPVLFTARSDLQAMMRGGASGSMKRQTRLFSLLIAGEAALTVLLLAGSGLMVRSLIRLQETDHGIRPDHILTMRVPIGSFTQAARGKYDSKPNQAAYYRELIERIRPLPGVEAVAVVNNLPLSEANTSVFIKGPDGQPLLNSTRTISPDYFTVMGIPRIAGRAFNDSDVTGAPYVVIINQVLARQLFPNRDPLGQPLPAAEGGPASTIVGVVKDTPQRRYDQPAQGELYLPYRQTIFGVFLSTIVVRTAGDPLSLAAALRKEIWSVDASQPIVKVQTMERVVSNSIWRSRLSAWAFSILASLALLLASAGMYAVVTYTSALRVREIGIRIALGAGAPQVVAITMRSTLVPLAAGLAGGIAAALLLNRWLASLLYEIRSSDPLSYLAAAALLLATGVAASAHPAWKAAHADPLQALRAE